MPQPVKACEGRLSEQAIAALQHGGSRAQWDTYPCEICGQDCSPRLNKGKWVPEPHWPTVKYVARTRHISKRGAPAPVKVTPTDQSEPA